MRNTLKFACQIIFDVLTQLGVAQGVYLVVEEIVVEVGGVTNCRGEMHLVRFACPEFVNVVDPGAFRGSAMF